MKKEKKAAEKKEEIKAMASQNEVEEVDQDEDDFDDDDMQTSSSGAGALATQKSAETSSAASGSLKNFRHHPDMENFYRFIYENDLRFDALQIIDRILLQKKKRKAARTAKARVN